MRLAIVYDSKTGNTKKMADYIVEGICQVEGAEARAFGLEDVDEAYVRSCCALMEMITASANSSAPARSSVRHSCSGSSI